MECQDSRACYLRGRKSNPDSRHCNALGEHAEPYKDGECPFCKAEDDSWKYPPREEYDKK